MSGGGSINDGEPEFQVAPMIDVLLTLLVFFMMITSAQVLKVDKAIQLPVSKNAIKKESKRSEVVVNIRWNTTTREPIFVIDDKVYHGPSDMIPVLINARAAADRNPVKDGPTFRAVIRGDLACPASHVADVMASCAAANISDISFSAVNKN